MLCGGDVSHNNSDGIYNGGQHISNMCSRWMESKSINMIARGSWCESCLPCVSVQELRGFSRAIMFYSS